VSLPFLSLRTSDHPFFSSQWGLTFSPFSSPRYFCSCPYHSVFALRRNQIIGRLCSSPRYVRFVVPWAPAVFSARPLINCRARSVGPHIAWFFLGSPPFKDLTFFFAPHRPERLLTCCPLSFPVRFRPWRSAIVFRHIPLGWNSSRQHFLFFSGGAHPSWRRVTSFLEVCSFPVFSQRFSLLAKKGEISDLRFFWCSLIPVFSLSSFPSLSHASHHLGGCTPPLVNLRLVPFFFGQRITVHDQIRSCNRGNSRGSPSFSFSVGRPCPSCAPAFDGRKTFSYVPQDSPPDEGRLRTFHPEWVLNRPPC